MKFYFNEKYEVIVKFDSNRTKEKELLYFLIDKLSSESNSVLVVVECIKVAKKINILDKVNALLLYSKYNYLVK